MNDQRGVPAKLAMAKLRADRIAANVCVQCGSPELQTRRRCAACSQSRLEADRARRLALKAAGALAFTTQQRDAAGLCPRCGGPRDSGYKTCLACRGANKLYRDTDGKIWIAERVQSGLCLKCDLPVTPGQRYCAEHHIVVRDGAQQRMQKFRKDRATTGRCCRCLEASLPYLDLCQYHHVHRLLSNYMSCPSPELVRGVTTKFNSLCAYTTQPIAMGVNGQLEHIYPKRHAPELMSEPTNLVWVCDVVNDAKADLLPDDPRLDTFMLPAVLARIRDLASKVVRPPQAGTI